MVETLDFVNKDNIFDILNKNNKVTNRLLKLGYFKLIIQVNIPQEDKNHTSFVSLWTKCGPFRLAGSGLKKTPRKLILQISMKVRSIDRNFTNLT